MADCQMFQEEPYDFAWCETHDETFPIGDVCPHHIAPFPKVPEGYVACRVIGERSLLTHLVELDEHGSNGGRPTACGLTRFDRFENGRVVPNSADLPVWGMGDSGVRGPGIRQFKCRECYETAA